MDLVEALASEPSFVYVESPPSPDKFSSVAGPHDPPVHDILAAMHDIQAQIETLEAQGESVQGAIACDLQRRDLLLAELEVLRLKEKNAKALTKLLTKELARLKFDHPPAPPAQHHYHFLATDPAASAPAPNPSAGTWRGMDLKRLFRAPTRKASAPSLRANIMAHKPAALVLRPLALRPLAARSPSLEYDDTPPDTPTLDSWRRESVQDKIARRRALSLSRTPVTAPLATVRTKKMKKGTWRSAVGRRREGEPEFEMIMTPDLS